MSQGPLAPDGRSALLARLPAGLDLEATAREHGALLRARGVPSAAALLRLALVYANTPSLPLRSTAAWAAAAGVADVSDVALLGRLRQAAGWLEAVLGHLLAARLAPPAGARVVELVDATAIAAPGKKPGRVWRVHAAFDLGRGRFSSLQLTTGSEAESLARFAPPAGAVCVADRFYAKAKGLLALSERRAAWVVRYGMTGCALLGEQGRRVGLEDVLAQGAELPELGERAVWVPRAGAAPLPARLILRRLPAEKAEAARARARRKAREHGAIAGARRLQSAGWLVLLTTLGPSVPAEAVLDLHRLRWQVELAFKRLKSQLGLGDLQAKEPRLARATLLAKLILAALSDQALAQALALSPSRPGAAALLVAAGPLGAHEPARGAARRAAPQAWLDRLDRLRRLLHEPPRGRISRLAQAWPLLS